jgi:hypothetical protein
MLQRLEAEDARMREMQHQISLLRAPMRKSTLSSPARQITSSPLRSEGTDSSFALSETKSNELVVALPRNDDKIRPDSAAHRPTNRDLADKDKEVLDHEKHLQVLQSENDFLMTAVMPLRIGLAGMARKVCAPFSNSIKTFLF